MNGAHLTSASPARTVTRTCWACNLCRHMLAQGIERLCAHPALLDPFTGAQPVTVIRSAGAACGPQAKHMQSVDVVDTRGAA